MDSEQSSFLAQVISGLERTAFLCEQAAKAASLKDHFQVFRQLASQRTQQVYELQQLEINSGAVTGSAGVQETALANPGEPEADLVTRILAAEQETVQLLEKELASGELPASVKQLLQRQLNASRQALALLPNLG